MSNITRRSFVQGSLAATAVLTSAPHFAKAKSPNGKMSVAIVGAGGRGGSHLGAFLGNSKTDVTYIVDVDEGAAKRRADAAEQRQGFRPKRSSHSCRRFIGRSSNRRPAA